MSGSVDVAGKQLRAIVERIENIEEEIRELAEAKKEGRILGGQKGRILCGKGCLTELVINLNAAKALNPDVPATLLARADEVIEQSAARSSRWS
jgi:hypothetical protein